MSSDNKISPPVLKEGLNQYYFMLILIYYWGLQFIKMTSEEVQPGGLMYWLYIIPIGIFAIIFSSKIFIIKYSTNAIKLIAIYGVIVSSVALIRGDFQTIASTSLFCLTIFGILGNQLYPSLSLLNKIFLFSIILNAIAFLAGRSIYPVIPGFARGGELIWRISIFPDVAPSAFFSLIVFFSNIIYGEKIIGRTCIALSLYFLLFSGIRSALIAGAIGGVYLLLVQKKILQRHRKKMIYLLASMCLFIVSLFMSQLLLLLPNFNNEFINMYLFRSESGLQNADEATKTIYRTWIWSEHFRIAQENPIFGVGTFDFVALSNIDPLIGGGSVGSESFITGLYARVGLPVIVMISSILSSIWRGLKMGQDIQLVIGILIFVAMLAYGSFVNVYDFVFLVMIGFLNVNKNV